MIFFGAVLVFFAIVLLVLGVTYRAPHPMSTRIASIRQEHERFTFSPQASSQGGKSILGSLAAGFGAMLQRLLPGRWVNNIERKLLQAGQPTTTTGFLGAAGITAIVMASFGVLMLTSSSMSGGLTPLVVIGCFALGFVLPKVWLDNRVRHRQQAILKSLPDAFDLITTCVEAGLGLEAALARVAEKTEGPFGEELIIMLHDVALGKLRREAMREVAERTGVPDLTAFINAVIQAESMGTSIAAVLRVQAEQMRTKRRQAAEQQAQAAPIKMMFPLVLFIFPTMFIVILGPAAISIYEQLVAGE